MILVLAHHYDAEADWLCRTVELDFQQAACLLWPEALGVDYRISLRLRGSGRHDALVSLVKPTASVFSGRSARYVINRLGYIEPLVWDKAIPSEKTYAAAEINAFFSAFVRSLPCSVSNPVRHGALWAGTGFEARWMSRLHRAGVLVHRLATADANEALQELSRADPATLLRWMHFEGQLFKPAGQERCYPDIERAILQESPDEMLELMAVVDPRTQRPQLLWLSRTPALSCYGRPFVSALADRAGGFAR